MSNPKIETAFPLTPLQEGMLLETLRSPSSGVYNGQCSVTLVGPLDEDRLKAAWAHLIRRHLALRSFFAWEGREQPLQVVRENVDLPWRSMDWSTWPEEEHGHAWEALLAADRRSPFNVEAAPLMRLLLVRTADGEHRLLWTVHHALVDGWSARLVLDEMLEVYGVLARGPVPDRLPPSSFAKFITWLEQRDSQAAERYWTERLEGLGDGTRLRLGVDRFEGASRAIAKEKLPLALAGRLRMSPSRLRVTPNTVAVGAWALVLSRHIYEGAEVTFGVTTAERPPEITGVGESVGPYINTVPVRIPMPEGQSARSWLETLQELVDEAREHSAGGLGDIARWADLAPGGALAHSLVVSESFPPDLVERRESDELRIDALEVSTPSDLPLALLVHATNDAELHLEYDTASYSPSEARGVLEVTVRAIESVLDAGESDLPADDLENAVLLGDEGRRVLIERLGTADGSEPPVHDVLELFEMRAAERPDAPAVRDTEGMLTYAELDAAANKRASTLLETVGSLSPLVAIPAERRTETVVSVLAVLKAGLGYTLIDCAQPQARRDVMLKHADLVLGEVDQDRWPVSRVSVAEDEHRHPTNLTASASDDDIAYVVWTSGSTGEPKGVVVERGHLARSNAARLAWYAGAEPTSFLMMSSFAVDSSVAGLFWTLSTGGCLVLPAEQAEQDMHSLAKLLEEASVTTTLLVPSLYRTLIEEVGVERLSALRTVIVAGEACSEELVVLHRRELPGVALYNEYGPSEATVWATADDLSGGSPVSIGRPVPFARVYVLDALGRLMPRGAPGEIVIGGGTVARGYLGDQERTADRFLPDPFVSGGRMYRTGDLGCFGTDGRLHFLGRIDDQIKLRGFRIEPGEVEAALASHAAIREVGVSLAPSGGGGAKRLTAAYVPVDVESDSAELKRFLARRLPAYMVPARFLAIDRLPRTQAGKLDRSSLATLVATSGESEERPRDASRSEAEETWVRIWQDVLGLEYVGVHDDFFESGGDSLLSIRVMARAVSAGLSVTPESFFRGPTIAELSAGFESAPEKADQGTVVGTAPLTPIQHWFFRTITTGRDHWNQSRLLRTPDWVDVTILREAIVALVTHHDALRTRFVEQDGGWIQDFTSEPNDAPLRTIDLVDKADREAVIEAEADAVHASFELSEGQLFQAVFFRETGAAGILLLVAHHLVVDAISWSILIDDLETLLSRAKDVEAPRLPDKSCSFRAWALALTESAGEPDAVSRAAAWLRSLDGPSGSTAFLPVPNTVADAVRATIVLDRSATEHLMGVVSNELDARPEALLLSAVLVAWRRTTGRDRLLLDVEGHGRDTIRRDVSRTVGWFTVTVPMALRLERDSIRRAVVVARGALEGSPGVRGLYGMLRDLTPDQEVRDSLSRFDGPPVLFNYLSAIERASGADRLLAFCEGTGGVKRSSSAPRGYVVEINAWLADGHLMVDVETPAGLRTPDAPINFAGTLRRALEELAVFARDEGPLMDLVGLDDRAVGRVADLLAEADGA